MRRRRGTALLAALAIAVLALLAADGAAAAAPEFTAAVVLDKGKYEVATTNVGQTVLITVSRQSGGGGESFASTDYAAHGTATERSLRASFGEFGEIAMRFQPSPRRTWVKPGRKCRGAGSFLVRTGTWVGDLRFDGEGGYLRLHVHRAPGTVSTIAPQCRRDPGQSRARPLIRPSQESFFGPEVPLFEASWQRPVSGAGFAATADRESSLFLATQAEARGRVAIFRFAQASGAPGEVSADRALTSGRVAPPAPFHGVGRYRAAPDGAVSWSGPLAVSFPGEPRFPLTGEPFETKLTLIPEEVASFFGLLSEQTPAGSGAMASPFP